MSYNAYITNIKNLHKHPNADRLQIGECFGNSVVVSLEYVDEQIGIYFPVDGKLSQKFAEKNNLLRKKDGAGNQVGGYMDPEKRNVTAVRLRGEKSDGLFLPLESLSDFCDIKTLKVGDAITVLNGETICEKYIPRGKKSVQHHGGGNKTRKKKVPIAPLFTEHADTEQLAYNLNAFKAGDLVEITLKMHGTSQRTGYVPVFQKYKRTFMDWLLRRPGTPVYDWGYVSGTRRTVLESYDGGYYGSNSFREKHSKFFEGKLHKGEEVYYEVVGFTDDGGTIMGICNNSKLNDKEFIKKYGKETVFSYGCSPIGREMVGDIVTKIESPKSDIYVYRMTMTNEDGDVVEYTPDFMRYRCEQMGVKTVQVFWKGFISPVRLENSNMTAGEWIKNHAEKFYDGPDPVGQSHIREGVVCRVINRPKFCAYKHKNFNFKCLEGIVKANAEAPDMEESEDVKEEP